MIKHRVLAAVLLAATVIGCNADSGLFGTSNLGYVRVINGSRTPFSVYVDGTLRQAVLNMADVSTINVNAGNHQIRVISSTGPELTFSARALSTELATAAVVGGGATPLAASILPDTGAIVPAGKTKVRVTHQAGGVQALEVWRTQPDFSTPIRVMTPFAYGATSPYLQSDQGKWEVFVTAPGSTTRLATTGPFDVAGGDKRTIAILDSAGVLKLRVLVE
jgi:hypothetical protein